MRRGRTPQWVEGGWAAPTGIAVDDHGKELTVAEMQDQRIGDSHAYRTYQASRLGAAHLLEQDGRGTRLLHEVERGDDEEAPDHRRSSRPSTISRRLASIRPVAPQIVSPTRSKKCIGRSSPPHGQSSPR